VLTDVLVVGAGPTGLMLANQLGRRGVGVTIIDRHSGPAQQSRAMAVHARTLEIYQKLGIADRALELGRKGVGANVWTGGRLQANIPLQDMGEGLSPFPYVLMLGQDDNEHIMGEHLRQWGLSIRWNTELVGVEQQPDCVKATIRDADGTTRTITAAYIAGCDGSRSSVRELCGIRFPGAPYEHAFFVADTEVTGPMVPEQLNVFLWANGFHLYFPMRGENRWRVIGIMPDDLAAKPNPRFEDLLPTLREIGGDKLSFTSCLWFSTYRIHHRCVDRFRDRRCFLLGDAAHVHSPVGAQGMNTGLQDAYNLAWKLSLVVQRRADESLLDSYHAERHPIAQRLLDTTDRGFRLIVSDSPFAGLLRTKVLARIAALVMKRRRVQNTAFRTVSQTGIHYRRSPLSVVAGALPKHAPRAGDRFPWMKLQLEAGGPIQDLFQALDDTRFNLLVFGDAAPKLPDLGGMLRVHAIPITAGNEAEQARAHVPRTAFFLLRPDGHVGLCGRAMDVATVERYFHRRIAGCDRPTPLVASVVKEGAC
jgi:2-polyprenyl-6-methoxyphenol hydroxylase-like FAD-dependent oxidoreductase